jgi:hypothetical protein
MWGEIHGNSVSPEGRLSFKLVKEQVKTKDTVQIPLDTQRCFNFFRNSISG